MIKIVVFDAYGTLFDVYSIGALAEKLFPGQGTTLSSLWRDKQVEYTRLVTMSDTEGPAGSRYYQSFEELTAASLRYCCHRLGLTLLPEHERQLMAQYTHLTAFPENIPVLKALRQQGLRTAILSNGNLEMLKPAVDSAGMTALLDEIISVASLRRFKTAPQCYDLVLRTFPVEKQEVLFVSSNAWDALGATWFGFTTLWVNRQNLPFETIGPKPSYTGSSLEKTLEIVAPSIS
ncbi:MAG: haloacid dehalogenase type II [Betaproteobacteria bacterium]|nr:haloacid dehalogenase type II [Betaproteobacteria bacterium]